MPGILGLDIGGANLKAAHTDGLARSLPFPLWKCPDKLADQIRELISTMPPSDSLAVTMTGELCDCFASRTEGVAAILDAIENVVEAIGIRVAIWTTSEVFVDVPAARSRPLQVASANWLATATVAASLVPDATALLIDMGSTTTDIVPLRNGLPVPRGLDDYDRLKIGELVYTGLRRTPVCAVLGPVVVGELFATMVDAYVATGQLPSNSDDLNTADGRPATRAHAHARLARMLGSDSDLLPTDTTRKLAESAIESQLQQIARAVEQVVAALPEQPRQIVACGAGGFLVPEILKRCPCAVDRIVSLDELWQPALSETACAYAVALLARDRVKV